MKEKTGGGSGENSRDAGDKPVFGTGENRVRIGIARDKAFCFYYKDNLELLEKLGCELVPFSPLSDPRLPDGLSGLIFGGGYPELYGRTLAENKGLLQEIHSLIEDGIPCLAECGGFMYLHEELEDREGQVWKMTGNIKGRTWPVGRLVRFGYVKIMPEEARTEAGYLFPGEEIRGHEFHYWGQHGQRIGLPGGKAGRTQELAVYPYGWKPVCGLSASVSSLASCICGAVCTQDAVSGDKGCEKTAEAGINTAKNKCGVDKCRKLPGWR